MTFQEAVAHFNNSRRKMAYALDLSIQAVQNWAKNPEKPIPNKRTKIVIKLIARILVFFSSFSFDKIVFLFFSSSRAVSVFSFP